MKKYTAFVRDNFDKSYTTVTSEYNTKADFFNDLAETYGDDIPVYLRNDNGYTYGNIDEYSSFTNDEEVEVDDE